MYNTHKFSLKKNCDDNNQDDNTHLNRSMHDNDNCLSWKY